jgi:hypothetical protein
MSQPRLPRLNCDSGYMIKRTPLKEKQKNNESQDPII